ncbi:T9SS type A sorting domain-containing protein [Dyadobacter flavalbus]|uniref:T9SS type A sorting domain-containing protein n=1 Tax=Dyadobacter flavalbus TaxID=2579942 RepID=A0A5M8QKR4_9BACT|nr:FG-GAP-like repeat-containing protein [Dyadobacter flavalbus]KAA6436649.1 T9SS type A sorting domain-containing protein [Dyadobacter flavalbus]
MKHHYRFIIFSLLACGAILEAGLLSDFVNQPASVQPVSAVKSAARRKPEKSVVSENSMSDIRQSLARREYNISEDGKKGVLQSPNRKQGLRAYYQPGTLTVQNRTDSTRHNFRLRLINKGIFADGKLLHLPQNDAQIKSEDNQLEIIHPGFTEQYINTEEGLRQNFIVRSAPDNARQLQVKLSAEGLQVNDLHTNELHFYTEKADGDLEKQLVYNDLKCWDANGKSLAATLAYQQNVVVITVAASRAAYPVTIDPLVTNGHPGNANKSLEGNQNFAWLGYSVASAGDVNGDGYSDVLAGAPYYDKGQNNEGAVFIYHGSATGLAANPALILESNQAEALLGHSVSSAGDVNKDGFSDVLAGAVNYDKGESNEGAVFAYYGSAAGVSTNGFAVLESNQADAGFGNSVALAGDVNADGFSDIIIGAHQYDKGESNEGAAFIYHGSASGIVTAPAATLERNQASATMGFSVASAGDVNADGYSDVLVGARLYDNGQTDEGAVFVYHGSAIGIAASNPALLESNQIDARMGYAVASAGDVNGDGYSDIVAGAYQYDKGETNEGAALVYKGSANGIIKDAVILESNQNEAQFGSAVASAGDVNGDGYSDLIIGARNYDNGQANEGTAFVYLGSAAGISTDASSKLESNQADAGLGNAVASAGDVNGDGYSDVIVGANSFDNGQKDEGAVYVFHGGGSGIDIQKETTLVSNQQGSRFGYSVASAGDVNGDGFSDVIIGAHQYDNGEVDKGAAFLYYGSVKGINFNIVTTLQCDQANANFGVSVASAGDVNGDGFGDVIVGAAEYTKGQTKEGAAFIFHGSATGINQIAAIILESDLAKALMGYSVASAGDVNGDGYDDVIVGAMDFNNGQLEEGKFYVFSGSPTGVVKAGAVSLESNQADTRLGASVAGAGDVNGDGYDDVIVGAYAFGDDDSGAAFIYYGSVTGLNINTGTSIKGNEAQANMGWSVSSAGDVNGDGFNDVIIGCTGCNNGYGTALVYYGSTNGINTNNKITLLSNQDFSASMGWSVSSAGDVNGDGYSDVIIGLSWYIDMDLVREIGEALIFYGSNTGIGTIASVIEGDKTGNYNSIGGSVAGAGDVNGDGYSDIITGAPDMSLQSLIKDAAFIYYGNKSGSLQNNTRLYNSDLATPINQSQLSKSDFGAGLFAKSFLGKNKGKLVWETKAKGQGFSKGSNNLITNSTQSSGSQNAYVSLGLTGTELKNVIAKQGPSTKVRVRVKYDPALAITGQIYGPWRYLPAYLNGSNMASARTETTQSAEKDKTEYSEAEEQVILYPNPVINHLKIISEKIVTELKVFDHAGNKVHAVKNKDGIQEVDLSDLSEGVYLIRLNEKTFKIIKE